MINCVQVFQSIFIGRQRFIKMLDSYGDDGGGDNDVDKVVCGPGYKQILIRSSQGVQCLP